MVVTFNFTFLIIYMARKKTSAEASSSESFNHSSPLGQATAQPGHQNLPSVDERGMAAIGYFWILCLLPLLGKRESAFAQFHGKQGLVLTMVSFIIWLVMWIPLIGWFIGFIGTLGVIAAAVTGILKAWQGEYWEMPILGEYAKKIQL